MVDSQRITEKVLTITEKSQRITDNSLTNHSTITVLSHTIHLEISEIWDLVSKKKDF